MIAPATGKAFAVLFQDLLRWDVKSHSIKIKSVFPVHHLRGLVQNRGNKVRLAEQADTTFRILGVSNKEGVFHAYDALGSNFKQPYQRVEAGDFFYNPYRVNVGSIGLVSSEHNGGYVSPAYVVFRTDEKRLYAEYLDLILRSDWYNKVLRAATSGSVRQNLTYDLLESLEVPLAPIETQRAIVNFWHAAKAVSDRFLQKAESAEAHIQQELLSSLGLSLPERRVTSCAFAVDWQVLTRWGVGVTRDAMNRPTFDGAKFPLACLSDVISDLENGWSPKCQNRPATEDEWGVLKLGAVSFGAYNAAENKALPKDLAPRPTYEVKSGDLLISRANITRLVGACVLVEDTRPRLMLCDKIFRAVWRQDRPVDKRFLVEVLKTPHVRWQIENNLTGASPTMKNITKSNLLALQFPLPPFETQQDIAEQLQSLREEGRRLAEDAASKEQQARADIEAIILGSKGIPGS